MGGGVLYLLNVGQIFPVEGRHRLRYTGTGPVSYTHLDVYKRQEYPLGTDEMGRCVFSRLLYGARSSMSIALPSLITVSYTHLDVYKRQE